MPKAILKFSILQNKLVITFIGCVCVICLSFFTCMLGKKGNENVQYYCETDMDYVEALWGSMEAALWDLKSGEVVSQSLDVPYPMLKGIRIYFRPNTPDKEGMEDISGYEVAMQILLDNIIVQEWRLEPADVISEKSLFLDKPLMVDGKNVELRVVVHSEEEKAPITIRATGAIENNRLSCRIGNTDTMRTLCLQIRGSYDMHEARLFIFCVFSYTILFLMLYNSICNPIFEKKNAIDKMIILGSMISCTFFFSHFNDMKIITELSYQLLKAIQEGKFFQFYEYALQNSEYPGNANYNILLYMITAAIDLPVLISNKLGFGISKILENIYINAVLCIVFYLTGKLLKKILVLWKLDAVDMEIAETFYYLNSILLFASVGYGQLDIVCATVLLWALYFYSKDKMDWFAIILSVSIAMKSFPLLLLLPLVLLREKRILYIMRYFIEGMFAPILFYLLYGRTEAWKEIQSQYDFVQSLFASTLTSRISLFCMLYIIICMVCYFHASMENYKNILLSGIAVYAAFAVFVEWFPHYLTIFAIFFGLSILLFEDRNKFMSVMFLAAVGYLGYVMWRRYYIYGNFMFYHGIILLGIEYDIPENSFISEISIGHFIEKYLPFKYMERMMFSIFAAAVIFITIKSIYFIKKTEIAEDVKSLPLYRGYLYLQTLPLYLIVIISVVMVLSF